MKHALSLFLLLASASAHALTPETGLWWNPAEPGRGFGIDVQDDFLIITVYIYTPAGEPVFYQGDGRLNGDFVEGELARKTNGQCITCEYRKPDTDVDFAGPFEIQFTSETTGVLTWEGGDVPIQRFIFGYSELQRMLGEWQFVLDFSVTNEGAFETEGDILRFDRTDVVNGQEQFLGYRVGSEFDRTNDVEDLGDAAGAYFEEDDLHVVLVDNSADDWVIYYLTVGTRTCEGIVEFYDKGADPTGEGFPVACVRTARRPEVQAKSVQIEPSVKGIIYEGLQVPLEARFGRASGDTVSLKSVTGKSVDLQALQETVRRLTRTLERREAR